LKHENIFISRGICVFLYSKEKTQHRKTNNNPHLPRSRLRSAVQAQTAYQIIA